MSGINGKRLDNLYMRTIVANYNFYTLLEYFTAIAEFRKLADKL